MNSDPHPDTRQPAWAGDSLSVWVDCCEAVNEPLIPWSVPLANHVPITLALYWACWSLCTGLCMVYWVLAAGQTCLSCYANLYACMGTYLFQVSCDWYECCKVSFGPRPMSNTDEQWSSPRYETACVSRGLFVCVGWLLRGSERTTHPLDHTPCKSFSIFISLVASLLIPVCFELYMALGWLPI